MSGGRCCEAVPSSPGSDEGAVERPPRRSYTSFAGWLVPGAVLAFMPKCPACLAAYVAVVTGLALPATAAAYLRTTLVALCIASLVYLGVRGFRRLFVRPFTEEG